MNKVMPSYLFRAGLLLAMASFATASTPSIRATSCSADAIEMPTVFGAQVTSMVASVMNNYGSTPGNDVCLVNITITHPGANDTVNNWVVLPLTGWNGVFQGLGGGGYAAGTLSALAVESALGYSAVTTDAGHDIDPALEGTAIEWALASVGNVNQYLLSNFARRSLHDSAVIGKAITQSFYGTPAKYSYWNGCSTGGRQGMVMAQYYPEDYDGILANAPAIQWNDFTPGQQWPFTVINNEGYVPTPCEFDAVNAAVIEACDAIDGQIDGIISAPAECGFEASSLVGSTFVCDTDGTTQTFSQELATIADLIWQGPRTPEGQFLWYGLTKGTNFSSLALTDSNRTIFPMTISNDWLRLFLVKDPNFDTANVSIANFSQFFLQGHIEYDSVIGINSPDLRAFKSRNGKIITWQGLADFLIFPQGTMLYYQKVLALDPSAADFYRQFYSPGVGHCGGGAGVMPIDAIGQLRAWVENGTAPASLMAGSEFPVNTTTGFPANGTNVRFLNLCPWPEVNVYDGTGDPALAESYLCVNGSGWQHFPGPKGREFEHCLGQPGWY